MDALTTYRLYAANPETARERAANKPEVAREVRYYQDNIGSVKSVEELMNNDRLYRFVMRAHGLEDMIFARAFMQKIIESGVEDEDSMANRLSDPRYRALAADFEFDKFGAATTAFERVTTGIVDKFYSQTIEIDAGNANNGARLALYFERKSPEIDNAYAILGDPALLEYVQTAFGLPSQMSFYSIEKQAAIIEEKLDFEKLSDTEYLDELTTRFLVNWDIANPAAPPATPLINVNSGIQGISLDLMTALQTVKR